MQYIFEDKVSTKVEAGQLSGKGIGLSAVRSEVEKLDGKIYVESKKNIGTSFIIEFN